MIGLDFGASLSAAASAASGIPSQADLEKKVLSPFTSAIGTYEGNASAYADKTANAYRTSMTILSGAKSIPGASSIINFVKIEAQVKTLGAQAYQKAMDVGAPPEVLAKMAFMATPEQLAASQKPAQKSFLLRPGAVQLFSTFQPKVTLIDPVPVRTEPQIQTPPPATTPMVLTSQPLVQPQPAPATPPPSPSWISKNWYWVVGGAAVLAGGGYVLYTQSKRTP